MLVMIIFWAVIAESTFSSIVLHPLACTAEQGACGGQSCCGDAGFANEGQLLLVNAASLANVDQRLAAQAKQPCADVSRFRPNLLVEGAPAFAEDAWTSISVGSAVFKNAGEVLTQVW